MSNTRTYLMSIVATLLITIILLGGLVYAMYAFIPAFGFAQVGQNELGLKRNEWTGAVTEDVYTQGRHEIGWFASMIKFPKVVQLVEFVSFSYEGEYQSVSTDNGPLNSRTRDGLMVILELSFTYQMQPLTLYDMYLEMGMNYELYYIREARSTIRDTASLYSAQEFFYNRTAIGIAMHSALQASLSNMYSDCPGFDLLNIDLPDSFENAIEQVQIAKQAYEKALIEQREAAIRADTEIIQAQAQANITVLSAEATAESYLINMEAQATALNITLSAQRLAYYAMGQELNLTSSELLTLLWIMAVMEHDSSLLIIGADTPILIEQALTNSTA